MKHFTSLHSTSSSPQKTALNNRLRSEQSRPIISSVSFTGWFILTRMRPTFLGEYFDKDSAQNQQGIILNILQNNLQPGALDRLKMSSPRIASMTLKNLMSQIGRIFLFISAVWNLDLKYWRIPRLCIKLLAVKRT